MTTDTEVRPVVRRVSGRIPGGRDRNKVKASHQPRRPHFCGGQLFSVHCALCHGPKGEGRTRTIARSSEAVHHAPDDAALLKVIEEGIRGTEMPGAGAMSDHEMRQTAAYVRSLGRVSIKPVPGNSAHGAEVFRGKGNCAGCHSIHGDGGVSGPDHGGYRRPA